MPDNAVMLPIEWKVPAGLPLRYASNIVVQHTQDEFVLSFFEVAPPLVLGPDDERLKQLRAISADCIARIVVSPRKYKEFLEAMRQNWDRYLESTAGPESGSVGDAE